MDYVSRDKFDLLKRFFFFKLLYKKLFSLFKIMELFGICNSAGVICSNSTEVMK